jgi:hypothetical protein
MFPKHRLLHKELNAFNRIDGKELERISVTKVIWIGEMIAIHFPAFAGANAHSIRHFVHPVEYSVGQSHVADGCHPRVPEKLAYSSSAQLVLDISVHYSILFLIPN